MRTLYDVLGVRPDADDEALVRAYRKAAKAHHPDLNVGDPDAVRRFEQIATAIKILRNPESRAAYDRSLERQRRNRIIIAEAIAAAVLTVVLVGGYALHGPTFSTSTTMSKVGNGAAPEPLARGGEHQAQRTGRTGDDEPRPGRNRGLTIEDEQSTAAERESAPVREQEGRQAAEREPPGAEPEAAPGRGRQERRQAGGRERRKASREIAVRREQREHRQAAEREPQKTEREAALRPGQASPGRFGPTEIAAARAFARF